MARKWLEELINAEYIPFIEGIKKSPAGRNKLTSFTEDMRNAWAERGLTSPAQQAAPWLTDTSLKSTIGSAQRTYLDSTDSVTEDLCQSIRQLL